LKVNVDRKPTRDGLKAILVGRGVVRVELEEAQRLP
jgi:hypothetical protein